jgi:hypothetical protein
MQEPEMLPDEEDGIDETEPGLRPRSYYYDDAHGYESYVPEEDEACEEDVKRDA